MRGPTVVEIVCRWEAPTIVLERWSNARGTVHYVARLPEHAGPESAPPALALCDARNGTRRSGTWRFNGGPATCRRCRRSADRIRREGKAEVREWVEV